MAGLRNRELSAIIQYVGSWGRVRTEQVGMGLAETARNDIWLPTLDAFRTVLVQPTSARTHETLSSEQ
jgi:hypothetical protein